MATITPTRMVLNQMKGRLKTASRGHKLLKDKRDELMRQFMDVVRRNKELMSILGEAALTPTDLLYAKFADEFEKRYVNQGYEENRSIEETLTIGWELLSILPERELKRIKPEFIAKYLPKKQQ